MQLQLAEILPFQGPKRAQANVQGDRRDLHSPLGQGRQESITEMEAGRWSRHRSRAGGVAGLVPLAVLGHSTMDIGGQGHLPIEIEQALQVCRFAIAGWKANDPTATGPIHLPHLHLERCSGRSRRKRSLQLQPLPKPHPLGGAQQAQPIRRPWLRLGSAFSPPRFQHQNLNAATTGPLGPQAGLHHPGVVDHQ